MYDSIRLFFIFSVIGSSISSCTSAERSKLGGFGSDHSIKCFSGGTLIYEAVSNGKVLSENSSDGYYFTEKDSGQLMEVSGDCVIRQF